MSNKWTVESFRTPENTDTVLRIYSESEKTLVRFTLQQYSNISEVDSPWTAALPQSDFIELLQAVFDAGWAAGLKPSAWAKTLEERRFEAAVNLAVAALSNEEENE